MFATNTKPTFVVPDRSKKNLGFGNQMHHAGKNIIEQALGDGKYGEQRRLVSTWKRFCRYVREVFNLNDLRDLKQPHVVAWAEYQRDRVENKTAPLDHR